MISIRVELNRRIHLSISFIGPLPDSGEKTGCANTRQAAMISLPHGPHRGVQFATADSGTCRLGLRGGGLCLGSSLTGVQVSCP
jgi:hypothetical protein